jgi:hypothetical protein
MDELTKIVLTSALTIIGGVIVLVIGQLVSKFMIEPTQELKKLLGDIRYSLVFYAREIHTPVEGDKERCDKAAEVLRKHSSDLRSKVAAVPCYNGIARVTFGFIPVRTSALEAAKRLMALSNSVHKPDRTRNWDIETVIYRLLGFGAPDDE